MGRVQAQDKHSEKYIDNKMSFAAFRNAYLYRTALGVMPLEKNESRAFFFDQYNFGFLVFEAMYV